MPRKKKIRDVGLLHTLKLDELSDSEFVAMATRPTLEWCMAQNVVDNKQGLLRTFRNFGMARLYQETIDRGMSVMQARYVCEYIFREAMFLHTKVLRRIPGTEGINSSNTLGV